MLPFQGQPSPLRTRMRLPSSQIHRQESLRHRRNLKNKRRRKSFPRTTLASRASPNTLHSGRPRRRPRPRQSSYNKTASLHRPRICSNSKTSTEAESRREKPRPLRKQPLLPRPRPRRRGLRQSTAPFTPSASNSSNSTKGRRITSGRCHRSSSLRHRRRVTVTPRPSRAVSIRFSGPCRKIGQRPQLLSTKMSL